MHREIVRNSAGSICIDDAVIQQRQSAIRVTAAQSQRSQPCFRQTARTVDRAVEG